MTTWIPLTIVIVGLVLILLGAYMSLADWNKKHRSESHSESHGLDKTFEGFAKLLEAMKHYPIGAQMIVFGIVLIIIGGVFGGVVALKP